MIPNNTKRVVLAGSYGLGNLGDEAICDAILEDILTVDTISRVTILVFKEDLFLKAHPALLRDNKLRVRSMDLRKRYLINPKTLWSIIMGFAAVVMSDTFIWGGGNLVRNRVYWLNLYLKPLLWAQMLKKRIVIWSIGVDKISDTKVIHLISKIRNPKFCSVRDISSRSNLSQISSHLSPTDIKVVRDPVFNRYNYQKAPNTTGPLRIGFNVTFWKGDFRDKAKVETFISSLAQSFKSILEDIDAVFVYMPSVPERDRPMYDAMLEHIKGLPIEYNALDTPVDYLEALSHLDIFVGMRMHSLILASNISNLPVIGIVYDEKVEAMKEELVLGNNFLTIEEVSGNPACLANKIEDTFKNLTVIHKPIADNALSLAYILK